MALSLKVKNLFGRRRDADGLSKVKITPAPTIVVPSHPADFFPLATDLSPIKEEEEIFSSTTPPISCPSTCLEEDGILPGDRSLFVDLSPSRVLRIIAASFEPLEKTSKEDHWLVESIVTASCVDRIFARRIAETARLLDDWCKEMETWTWNGDFETVEREGNEHKASRQPLSANSSSLSISRTFEIAQRVDEILEDLFDLDILKHRKYIMSLCSGAENSDVEDRPDSAVGLPLPTKPKLDNLSTLVTIIYVRSIATHTKVLALASAWHARIDIVQLQPRLLEGMSALCNAFKSAWRMTSNTQPINQDVYSKTKHSLMIQHNALALQLDDMLDILEDQDDVLPERWIDMIDRVEEDIKHWANVTEKRLSAQERILHSERRPSIIRQRGASLAIAAASALDVFRGTRGRYDYEEYDDDDNDNENTNNHEGQVGKDDTANNHDQAHDHDQEHNREHDEASNEHLEGPATPHSHPLNSQAPASATLHPRKSRQLLKPGSSNTQTRKFVPGRQERNDAAVVPLRMFRIARKPVPCRERVRTERSSAQILDSAGCVAEDAGMKGGMNG